jgi:hypothetical protein
MKAGAMPLWSYHCAPFRINDLRATLTFDTAYDQIMNGLYPR